MGKEKEQEYDPEAVLKETEEALEQNEHNPFGSEGSDTVTCEVGSFFKKLFG